ncbi:hypothetical protein [Pedobacter agri]|uniref:hypothetical protein n=1 Tax=Pedobacter agri TaxID=454586 RepID=UPI00292EB47B|nr:hypothetical protein [Pedobacter agri]
MSRSVRKTPIFGNAYGNSEKQDKRKWNRVFRKFCRKLILKGNEAPIKISAVTDVWDGNKDGKRFRRNVGKKDMRK